MQIYLINQGDLTEFNPYHDARGRFTQAQNAGMWSHEKYRPASAPSRRPSSPPGRGLRVKRPPSAPPRPASGLQEKWSDAARAASARARRAKVGRLFKFGTEYPGAKRHYQPEKAERQYGWLRRARISL